jgi:hypothetical protein
MAYEELYRMLIDYGVPPYRAAGVLTLAFCAAQADLEAKLPPPKVVLHR